MMLHTLIRPSLSLRVHSRMLRQGAYTLAICATLAGCSRKQGDAPVDPPLRFPLAVAITGDGRVTSVPAGIDCTASNGTSSGTCQTEFVVGTTVTLQAVAANGLVLERWNGACSGASGCDVTIHNAQNVAALFSVVRRTLQLRLTTPNSSDGIVLMTLTGPSLAAVRPRAGIDLVVRESTLPDGQVQTTILASGAIATGVLAEVDVRGGPATGPVQGVVVQAAASADGHYARRIALTGYVIVASP